MKNLIKYSMAIGLAVGVTAASTSTSAHDSADDVVKHRMEAMGNLGSAMKGIKANLKPETTEHHEGLLKAATMIMDHSGVHLNKLFPEGSGGGKSRALPAIWEKKDQFDSISQRLQDSTVL
jgi:cytochrome c556